MTAQTILDVFEPPEGRVAHSAALVAMTGARDFLEDGLVRFTGLKARQRTELGITNAYLLLDAQATPVRAAVFAPHELPGLHELQPRAVAPALLHAKLALLAFAPSRTGAPTDVRLAILTANFTYTCAKHQLELAWMVDVALAEEASAPDRAAVADAADFVATLIDRRYHLAERALPAKRRRLTARLDILLETCRGLRPERAVSGFIHSLDEPLHPQIKRQMKRLRTSAKRNFLLCGSGFYEEPGPGAGKPTVLAKLEDLGGFTGKVRRVAIAEPTRAGALAPWARAGAVDGWELAAPHDAEGLNRTLHAKFIYVGWLRDGAASNGCLYLGSGNLSRRGLLSAESAARDKKTAHGHDGVNIECGVVLTVKQLEAEDLASSLFWHGTDEQLAFDEWAPGVGPEDVDEPAIVASPILVARVIAEGELALEWRADVGDGPYTVRTGLEWIEVIRGQASTTLSAGAHPDVLRVRDVSTAREWIVPVVDAVGRTCWTPPRFETYDDALAALLDFPIRPVEGCGDDDDDEGGDGDDREPPTVATPRPADDHIKSYALHAAADLLERTAALQQSLDPAMLDDWLDHIERFFHASFPAALIATWRSYRVDVFAHLRAAELRPREMTAKQRGRYEAILAAVAAAWGLR